MSLAALSQEYSPGGMSPTPGPSPPPVIPTQSNKRDSFLRCCQNLQKWGIPVLPDMYSAATVASHLQEYNDDAFQHKRQQALEQTLRQRLIWVCYRGRYLWPAILYDNYRQLIHDEDLAVNVWFNILTLYIHLWNSSAHPPDTVLYSTRINL